MGNGVLSLLSSIAEDERERITRRAKEGHDVAKQQGVKFGPKHKLTEHQRERERERKAEGDSLAAIAADFGVSKATIGRV